MSFTWFRPEGPLLSRTDVVLRVYDVCLKRKLTNPRLATVLVIMGISQEAGAHWAKSGRREFWCPANDADPSSLKYKHDSKSNDGRSVGYLQQQNGRAGEQLPAVDRDNWWGNMATRMDLKPSVNNFLARLSDDYVTVENKWQATELIANVQNCRKDLRGKYADWWDFAWDLVNRVLDTPIIQPPKETDMRPAYNEFALWSPNNNARTRKPDLFLLHTQEGGSGNAAAENLAKWMQGPVGVSYHYTVSQASDGGVTVVDCVDTDRYSWSVLDANNRSINACFAGSRVAWTREEWLSKAGNAIRVMAWLAVADCKKYGIDPRVIVPPYKLDPPGISDHRYVTEYLDVGNHTDVGDNFPWDVFVKAVTEFAIGVVPVPSPPPPAPVPPGFQFPSQEIMVREIWQQLRGVQGRGWKQLGQNENGEDMTLVDAVAALLKKESKG